MQKQLMVKKAYGVVTARMSLDANEQNLLNLLIEKLKLTATNYREKLIRGNKKTGQLVSYDIPINPDDLPSVFEFKLNELADVMGVTNSALSKTLDETTTKMMQRVIRWPLENGGFYKEQLLGPSKYHKGKGVLSLTLHPRSKEAILEETRGVSIVDLRFSLRLKGGYEKRILDMISTFKNQRNFELDFNSFQDVIGAKVEEYSQGLKAFRAVVLDRPLKRLFNESDGVWEPKDEKGKGYELIKEGRTVKKIIFKVKYNDPQTLQDIKDKFYDEFMSDNDDPIKQPYEYTLLGMEDKIRTFTKMNDAVMMHLIAYEATAKNEGYKIPAEIVARIKMLRK